MNNKIRGEREENRGEGVRVTVVERELEPHEIEAQERADLRAAIAELQAELARLRPGWRPRNPI